MADDAGKVRPGMTRAGIAPRIIRSWLKPGQVVQELRGMPDRVLIVILLVAMLIFFVSQLPAHARAAGLDPSIPLNARISGALFATMFLMPPLCYLVAAIVSGLFRLTGWQLDPEDARLALFWSLLAVAPAMLLSGLTAGFIGSGAALTVTQIIAGLGFLYIWGGSIRALMRKR